MLKATITSGFYRETLCQSSTSCHLCLSVSHKSVFYQNVWTDEARFWQRGFLRPIQHSTLCYQEIYISTKIWVLPPGTS